MYLLKRSGTLTLVSVAASFLFYGCQSTQSSREDESAVAPLAEVPADLLSEIPKEADIVRSKEAELRELEEAIQEEAKPKSSAPRSLHEQAAFFGAALKHLPETKQWQLSKAGRTVLLKEDSRNAVLDGVKVILDAPLKRVRGNWLLSKSDQDLVLRSAFEKGSAKPLAGGTIVIDPGHGGLHDGAKNEKIGLIEKDLALDVSLRLQGHLEKQGFKVVLTRYDDRHVELKDRPAIANDLKADLFLSIHFNASLNASANGLETYILTPAGHPSSSASEVGADAVLYAGNAQDRQSFELAYRIQKSMLSRLAREDRGVKKGRWAVLKSLTCPGVLVECGFVSNENEGLLVGTAGYRERVSLALLDAILSYTGSELGE